MPAQNQIAIAIKADTAELVRLQSEFVRLRDSMRGVAGMTQLGAIFSAAGLAVHSLTSQIAAAATGSERLADELDNLRQRLKISAFDAQVFGAALADSGAGLGALQTGVTFLTRALADAARGAKEPNDALQRLGLSAAALARLPLPAQLEAIARAFTAASDPADALDAVMQLLGRGSTELLPLLRRLAAEGFAGLSQSAQATRGILSDELVAALDAVGDRAAAAQERLTKNLARANLTLATWRARLVELAADHTPIIEAVSLGAVGAGLGAAITRAVPLALAAIGLPLRSRMFSLGSVLGQAFSGAFIVGAGYAIIQGITAAVIEASDRAAAQVKTQVDAWTASLARVRGVRSEEDLARERARLTAEIAALEKRRDEVRQRNTQPDSFTEFGVIPGGLSREGKDQIASLELDLRRLRGQLAVVNDERGRALVLANQEADAAARKAALEKEAALWLRENRAAAEDNARAYAIGLLPLEDQLAALRQIRSELESQQQAILDDATIGADERARRLIQLRARLLEIEAKIAQTRQAADAEAAGRASALATRQDRENALRLAVLENQQRFLAGDPWENPARKQERLLALLREQNAEIERQIRLQLERLAAAEHAGDADAAQAARERIEDLDRRQDETGRATATLQNTSPGFAQTQGLIQTNLNPQTGALINPWMELDTFISGTLQTSMNGLSESITGLITGTQSWGEVWLRVQNQILAGIVQMILEYTVFYQVRRLLDTLFHRTSQTNIAATAAVGNTAAATTAATQSAAAATVAAAGAPAAAATSIWSFGSAAGLGLALALAAIGAIIGALAFAEGGIVPGAGGPTADDRLAWLSSGEGVLTARAVRHYGGASFVAALNDLALPARPDPGPALAAALPGGLEPAAAPNVNVAAPTPQIFIVQSEEEALRALETTGGRAVIRRIVGQQLLDLGVETR
jgi:hypothetical protein